MPASVNARARAREGPASIGRGLWSEVGSEAGIDAWNAARRYFDGTAGS